jgi:hypothetical protein
VAERVVPMQVGGVELLVTTVVLPGSEQTSGARIAKAAEAVVDAFDTAGAAIEAVAGKVAATVVSLSTRAVAPEKVSVEFGLSFTASGGVIVAGASAQASLKVTVSYAGGPSTPTSAAG